MISNNGKLLGEPHLQQPFFDILPTESVREERAIRRVDTFLYFYTALAGLGS